MIKGGLVARFVERMPRDMRRRAWRAAAAGRRAVTAPTTRLRVLPDYLIAGGQRCGTTSLQKYLIQHPGVTPPGVMKGIHYFDTNYTRGVSWYRSHFPTRMKRAAMERNGGMLLTGEASPYYMFHPLGAARIAADVPDAKVIMLVRDPVARAYSHYLHEQRRGFEEETFARALELEPERLAGEEDLMRRDPGYISFAHQHHSYVARGLYIDQIERMIDHLGRDQVLVITSEDMFRDAEATYHEVLRFLGLPLYTPEDFKTQNANVYKDPIPASIRADLSARFAEPNRRLEEFMGRSLGWN